MLVLGSWLDWRVGQLATVDVEPLQAARDLSRGSNDEGRGHAGAGDGGIRALGMRVGVFWVFSLRDLPCAAILRLSVLGL